MKKCAKFIYLSVVCEGLEIDWFASLGLYDLANIPQQQPGVNERNPFVMVFLPYTHHCWLVWGLVGRQDTGFVAILWFITFFCTVHI